MKKLTLASGESPRTSGKKTGVVRGLAAFILVLAMALMLYLLAHLALTDDDSIIRGLAALAFLTCTAATAAIIAFGVRKWFEQRPVE